MLIAISEYLSVRGLTSLADLSQHFDTSTDAMRDMLNHWVRKGRVIREISGCSKGCVSCAPERLELYRWIGAAKRQIPLACL
ncbi:hypothetical protein CI610_00878 [invertebrate metagenome]|uniref:Transcriptional regulator HTH-type FeoC domain-containing protein n=1 Tax=invertebrate metagenome TaxID=1711999 RepID=A0A2H9TAB2_9ZZZZ